MKQYFFQILGVPNWLAKPIAGHPLLTWLVSLATLAAFAGEGLGTGFTAGGAQSDFWISLGFWVFALTLGALATWITRSQVMAVAAERLQRASRLTVFGQLIWLGLTAVVWLLSTGRLAQVPVHGLLASLLLLPSFSLQLILLQRGLRDKGLEADVILVNKSGTLTTGRRKLAFVQLAANSPLESDDAVLAIAAGLEPKDLDDIAKAIRSATKRRQVAPVEVKDVMRIMGVGMSGRIDGSRVVLAGPAQLVAQNVRVEVADLVRADRANTEGQTVVYLLLDGELCGYIGFADQLRGDVRFFIQLLQYRRKRVIVYSGDAHETTKFVSTQLECDGFYGEVLPHEYENLLQKISSDGSVILESTDLAATALQIERAVRDRRLQWVAASVSLGIPVFGLVFGIIKLLVNERPGIFLPSVGSAFGISFAVVTIVLSAMVWRRIPSAISAATIKDEVEDD